MITALSYFLWNLSLADNKFGILTSILYFVSLAMSLITDIAIFTALISFSEGY